MSPPAGRFLVLFQHDEAVSWPSSNVASLCGGHQPLHHEAKHIQGHYSHDHRNSPATGTRQWVERRREDLQEDVDIRGPPARMRIIVGFIFVVFFANVSGDGLLLFLWLILTGE